MWPRQWKPPRAKMDIFNINQKGIDSSSHHHQNYKSHAGNHHPALDEDDDDLVPEISFDADVLNLNFFDNPDFNGTNTITSMPTPPISACSSNNANLQTNFSCDFGEPGSVESLTSPISPLSNVATPHSTPLENGSDQFNNHGLTKSIPESSSAKKGKWKANTVWFMCGFCVGTLWTKQIGT